MAQWFGYFVENTIKNIHYFHLFIQRIFAVSLSLDIQSSLFNQILLLLSTVYRGRKLLFLVRNREFYAS